MDGIRIVVLVMSAAFWLISINPSAAAASVVRDFEWEYAPKALRAEPAPTTVNEDQYVTYPITVGAYSSRLEFRITVTYGPTIDVYLVDATNLELFKQGSQFRYLIPGTDESTRDTIQTVPTAGLSGTYYIIVDNTDMGATQPPYNGVNDAATVAVTIRHWLGFGFQLTIPDEAHEAYRHVSIDERRTHWGFLVTTNDSYVREVANYLVRVSTESSLQPYDLLSNMLAFSQSLPYTPDSVTTGFDEYPRFPIETLAADGGDCEDTAILFATLVQLAGHGAVLLAPPSHMAVGVAGTDLPGTFYEFEQRKYYFAETTGIGFEIGQLPSEYSGSQVQIFSITGAQYVPSYQGGGLDEVPANGLGVTALALAALAFSQRAFFGRAKGNR